MGQCAMLLRTPSLIGPGKGIIYWNLQLDVPQGWVNEFAPLGEGKLLNLHWDPFVLLQAGPVEMHYIWTRILTTKRRQKVGVLTWHIPNPSAHS